MRFVFILTVIISHNSYSQIKNKQLNKIRSETTCLIYAREQDRGFIIDNSDARKGIFTLSDEIFGTRMLLGSASYLFTFLNKEFSDFKAIDLPSKSIFFDYHTKYNFDNSEIDIYRKFDSNALWKNSSASLYPENYQLVYSFTTGKHDGIINNLINVKFHKVVPFSLVSFSGINLVFFV